MNDERDAPVSELQLKLMAYVDDELTPNERRQFEAVLAEDADLAAEAAAQKNLLDLSRAMTLAEPTDHEIRRFWAKFYNRTEWQVAWVLLVLGIAGILVEGIYLLVTSPHLTWVMKAAALCALAGGGLLIWNTARLKLRTSRFDRYRGVMR